MTRLVRARRILRRLHYYFVCDSVQLGWIVPIHAIAPIMRFDDPTETTSPAVLALIQLKSVELL